MATEMTVSETQIVVEREVTVRFADVGGIVDHYCS
jgi:hypothetical protein